MTLIIASATHKTQLIVADRQVTRQDGRPFDELAYKIIQYVNYGQDYRCAIAYAGLARLGKHRTVDWLMDTLPRAMDSSTDLYYAIGNLRTACDNEITPRLRSIQRLYRGLTIVLCGRYNRFGAVNKGAQYIPFLSVISNCEDKRGRLLDQVADGFSAYSHRLLRPSANVSVCRGDLGAAIRFRAELRDLFRYLRRDISPAAKAKLAADFVRLVARKSKWIGQSILGFVLTGSGAAEGFDFPVQTDVTAKTLPHLVTDQGNRLTNFLVDSIEKHRDYIESLPPSKPWSAVVLTDWVGSGTSADPRHPALADDYELGGYSDLTGADSWPKNEKCPYYGLLVGVWASPETIDAIRDDPKYLIVVGQTDNTGTALESGWLNRVQAWFHSRGMDHVEAEEFAWGLERLTSESILQELNLLLRAPRAVAGSASLAKEIGGSDDSSERD